MGKSVSKTESAPPPTANIQSHRIDLSKDPSTDHGPVNREKVVQASRAVLHLKVGGSDIESSWVNAVAVSFMSKDGIKTSGIILCYKHDMGLSSDTEYSLHYRPLGNSDSTTAVSLSAVKPECTFTCPLLYFSFIQLSQETVESLKQSGCFFYNLQDQVSPVEAEDTIYLLQSPTPASTANTSSSLHYVQGSVKEHYGQDIWYKAVCSFAPGIPLFNSSGELVGLHKSDGTVTAQDDKETQCTLAIPLTAVATVLTQVSLNCDSQSLSLRSNPVDLTSYGTQLEEIGLEVMSLNPSSERYKGCLMYISPANLREYITAIWFMPTCMGWYWSPTDPEGELCPNWMPVNRLEVIGGFWHGQIPAPKNVTIIRWLDQHNITAICYTR
ncbi:PREDICTED: uncharacterized protein LOC109583670 isoform X2 [Amphimedon queenslandica]|uniref:Uncharacterized protein n=2 Tax=Amphimedon queenslandica TaxID=400682 RepID=A0A1X7UFS8_AMPQE|nr:PREDICTED: uncharacterized protein LOC109583670 isoform X2 [Amphimedon queenslandica]|eukprot:XP_019854664.1 PREDICTED: uncharacterized protein LOC109583670 isoform X2 [Amphimedon queenslandica]